MLGLIAWTVFCIGFACNLIANTKETPSEDLKSQWARAFLAHFGFWAVIWAFALGCYLLVERLM
jgi:hypothetical protein